MGKVHPARDVLPRDLEGRSLEWPPRVLGSSRPATILSSHLVTQGAMRWRSFVLSISLTMLVLAGCIDTKDAGEDAALKGIDHAAIAALIGSPIEVEHDHRDPTHEDHWGGVNLELVSWNTLDVTLGEMGFANFVFHVTDDETLAFVAIDGDTRGGFVIADIADPLDVQVLGSTFMNGNSVQEVRVTPDGNYALMNVQAIPGANALLDLGLLRDCTVCLHLYDVRDRSAPVWLDALPVDLLGTHNMHVHVIDGATYVFYVGQPLSYEHPSNLPGNYVGIAEVVEVAGAAKLVKVGHWRDPTVSSVAGWSFPHDVMVYEHPITGQHIGYVSYWDGGAVTVDFSDPLRPVTLDANREYGPSGALAIHWFAPEQGVRADGRLVAWSAPEIGDLDSDAGAIRAYDVTDPADIRYLGAWMAPDLWIPGKFVFSGHTTVDDQERGLLAVSHYHAGVWVLDLTDPSDPRHLAYYMPNGDATGPYEGPIWWKKPNFDPEGFLPNVYQARWLDGLLWVSERGTGLYALEYTGPVPGSVL
jgi:hypothetical protein